MVNVISEVSEEKILDLINQETRIDKRSFEEYRDITIKTDYISKANGSALVSIGATTVVAVADTCSVMEEEPKIVYLDRPFVYMLIDCETNIPFFVGTMMSVNE